jgi:hypothetical protein
MSTPPPLPILTELKLNEQIRALVNGAFERGLVMVFGYVDDDGTPNLSPRGTLQVFSDTQLALWARNPEGGLLRAIGRHAVVSAIYIELDWSKYTSRSFLTFRGRGRVDASEQVRRVVYENSPQRERDSDKERKGSAIVIDLDSVTGLMPGARLAMRR